MIYYFTPYATDRNLGRYYNDCLAMVPKGSWACFVDGDAMFTTPDFGHQLQEIIDQNDYKLYTCKTNRVGTNYQLVNGTWDLESMYTHRSIGKFLQLNKRHEVRDITKEAPMSGVLMLVNKDAWFCSDRFKESGLLGIDNSIHYAIRNAGHKVGLMEGVYVQHYYRNGNVKDTSHLQ